MSLGEPGCLMIREQVGPGPVLSRQGARGEEALGAVRSLVLECPKMCEQRCNCKRLHMLDASRLVTCFAAPCPLPSELQSRAATYVGNPMACRCTSGAVELPSHRGC